MARVRRLAVLCCCCLTIMAQAVFGQALLNPTVKVLPKPSMIVPTDCAEGLAQAPPRPTVEAEVEAAPKAPVVPPSSDLRTALRRVQAAAENNDYNGFKNALADARAAVSAYPGGGEKQAANDVLQVDADIQRLWDYSITSPTGAFFNASNEDLLTMLRKYPGWTRAVADATMTVGGETIYPSRETRQFLTEEGAKRLRNLGVRTPTRVVQEQPRIITPPKVTTPKRQQAPQPRVHVATHHTPKPPAKIAQAAPRPTVHKRHEEEKAPIVATPIPPPVPVAKPAPVPAPTPTPATITTETTDTAAAATTSTAAQPPSAVPTTATTATTAATATTESAPAATTSTETTSSTEKPAGAAGGMNLTFAIILIVVGIGVLIVLFRASD